MNAAAAKWIAVLDDLKFLYDSDFFRDSSFSGCSNAMANSSSVRRFSSGVVCRTNHAYIS